MIFLPQKPPGHLSVLGKPVNREEACRLVPLCFTYVGGVFSNRIVHQVLGANQEQWQESVLFLISLEPSWPTLGRGGSHTWHWAAFVWDSYFNRLPETLLLVAFREFIWQRHCVEPAAASRGRPLMLLLIMGWTSSSTYFWGLSLNSWGVWHSCFQLHLCQRLGSAARQLLLAHILRFNLFIICNATSNPSLNYFHNYFGHIDSHKFSFPLGSLEFPLLGICWHFAVILNARVSSTVQGGERAAIPTPNKCTLVFWNW